MILSLEQCRCHFPVEPNLTPASSINMTDSCPPLCIPFPISSLALIYSLFFTPSPPPSHSLILFWTSVGPGSRSSFFIRAQKNLPLRLTEVTNPLVLLYLRTYFTQIFSCFQTTWASLQSAAKSAPQKSVEICPFITQLCESTSALIWLTILQRFAYFSK